MSDIVTKEQRLSGLTGVTDIVDLLNNVNLVQYKTGWTSKHLAADAIREITRLRQLLSEAETREREARAKALEEAANVARAVSDENRTGWKDTLSAHTVAKAIEDRIKALQQDASNVTSQ
ncbi:hypothetical protein [Agrobacterium pusense]|uniref:hypothetical protein n=1 Tax=Agrobacterium pusense TaxID=648995 RepID=UPI00345E47EC